MPREKEKVYLNKFEEELKNPSHNKYVLVYTENEGGPKPVNKPKDRITLRQVVDMIQKLDTKVDAGFKQVNSRIDNLEKRLDKVEARLDYIVSANNLKDNK